MSLTERRTEWAYPDPELTVPSVPLGFSVDMVALQYQTILTLHGELDASTQRDLVLALDAIDGDVGCVVLDLSDLRFIDASSIGIINQRRTLLEERGGALVFRSPNVQVKRILDLTDAVRRPITLPRPAPNLHSRTSPRGRDS